MRQTVYVICTSEAVAARLALRIDEGTIPGLYRSQDDCLAWWRAYPAPLKRNHLPYEVTLSESGKIDAVKRLAAPLLN